MTINVLFSILLHRIVAMLEKNGVLKIASVGDCGLRVIRKGKKYPGFSACSTCKLLLDVSSSNDTTWELIELTGKLIFSTLPQEHYFDCPYQLSSEVITQTYLDATVWWLTRYIQHSYYIMVTFNFEGKKITPIDWIKLHSTSSHLDHCQLISLQKQVTSVKLLEGDTIVMGSDGLFDNVFDHEIVSTITQYSDAAEAGRCLQIQPICENLLI